MIDADELDDDGQHDTTQRLEPLDIVERFFAI